MRIDERTHFLALTALGAFVGPMSGAEIDAESFEEPSSDDAVQVDDDMEDDSDVA